MLTECARKTLVERSSSIALRILRERDQTPKESLSLQEGISEVFLRRKGALNYQESRQQTKPKKGPKRKVHEFRPFL